MKYLAIAACVGLTACASPQQLYQSAMNETPANACFYAMAAQNDNYRSAAARAVQARGINCDPYMSYVNARIMARAAQEQQSNALAWQLLNAGRAQPPAPSNTLQANCRTVNRGTYLQTVCD